MAGNADELQRLRRTLAEAQQQSERDRITIEALRHEAADHRREAQHQVHNILSVVRSIARRTAQEGETAEEYQVRIDSRLASFARLQGYILRNPAAGLDLCTLVVDELLAFGVGLGRQANVDGDAVRIDPKAASVLGLAIHELARMAIEDGQSAGVDGRIDVRWGMQVSDGPAHLQIEWVETGRRAGARSTAVFGREVLEQAVGYDLKGSVELIPTDDGLVCRVLLPTDCVV